MDSLYIVMPAYNEEKYIEKCINGIKKASENALPCKTEIIVVANLAPAKLCGVESNGMILAADTEDGGAKVIFPDDSLPCGTKIR